MTMILVDGFDHADFEHVWTASTFQLQTDIVRTGSRSALTTASNSGAVNYRALAAAEVDDGVTMGAAFYISSSGVGGGFLAGSQGPRIFFAEDAIIHMSANFRSNTRTIELWRGNAATGTRLAFTDTNIFTFDTWNYLELGVKVADSGGLAEVRLNGVPVIDFAGDTRNAGTTGIINRMGLMGINDVGSSQQVRYEDVYMLNEQGSAPWNSFLGDTRCYPLYPIGNGFYAMLVGSDADSVDNYLLVDEAGVPVTTDYVGSATDGDIDTYDFQSFAALQNVGTIMAVESRIHAAKTETGTRQARLIVRRSSTDAVGPDHILAENSYATYRYIMELDPHAGPGAWTIPNLDNTEFGVEVRP